MNQKELREMIKIMNENNLDELEIEKEGLRLKLKKATAQTASSLSPESIVIEQKGPASRPSAPEAPAPEAPSKAIEIKAPMVGTFYRAPSPESPPYVEVGQVIEPGQIICIIEAMKLMNEIKAEVKGKLVEVLVENAEPVEFGQPLFLIEPV